MPRGLLLPWRDLEALVQSGQLEPRDADGKTKFMFWSNRAKASFISDPLLLDQIARARRHRNPFVLIGPQHTGKNIFLQLVARGSEGTKSIPCVDENVAGDQASELERFFGPSGVVERSLKSLLHFDFMERAITWNGFVEKVHKVAVEKVLERTDGKVIPCPKLRVVLGANVDLQPLLPRGPALIRYLYGALSSNQFAQMRTLEDQPERLPTIMAEMIATLVLRGDATKNQASAVERIPLAAITRLREYSVPDRFTGLFRIVRDAIHTGDWNGAIANTQPGTVFVVWGGSSRHKAFRLADRLRDTGVIVERAPKVLKPGPWWPQIQFRLSKADFILFTFSRSDFSPNMRSDKFREWHEAVELEKSLFRTLIIPVCLDRTDPRELEKMYGANPIVRNLLGRQWYWVSDRTGSGFADLRRDLQAEFHKLRNP
jgi:hypothetical protein